MSTVPPDAGNEQPAYQQPPANAPQAAQPGNVSDPVSTLTLNYWLSVFFTWIPALIFWIIEKDKGNQRATAFHVANLNFSLLRTIVGVAAAIIVSIPYIGWVLGFLLWIGSIVLFVFHIIAAAKVANEYHGSGKPDPFIFNIPMIK